MTIEILGAGFGRTGTNSLKLALEEIGLGPCYHMHEVAKNTGHVDLWDSAIHKGHFDADILYKNYKSAVDWPTVAFLPFLIKKYPEAKIILTLRDPSEWYESAKCTIFEAMLSGSLNPDMDARRRVAMSRRLILERTFSEKYFDKEYCINVYEKHIESVVEAVPKERLLKYSVTEGWGSLCRFLDVSIPNTPFPVTNDRKSFLAKKPSWAK